MRGEMSPVRCRILLVDDEKWYQEDLQAILGAEYEVTHVARVKEIGSVFTPGAFDAVLANMYLVDGTGHDVLHEVMDRDPICPVIIVSQFAATDDAVRALKEGAAYYIEKGQTGDYVRGVIEAEIQKAGERRREAERRERERAMVGEPIAASPAMRPVVEAIETFAPRPRIPVLLWGEPGVGKEYLARWLHVRSAAVALGEFLVIRCRGLAAERAAEVLFGNPPVDGGRPVCGALELGGGSTAYLDDADGLPLEVQARLRDAMEEGRFIRSGTSVRAEVTARVVLAVSGDPELLAKEGKLDRKLFVFLRPGRIRVPPLRERPEDLDALIDRILGQIREKQGQGPVLTGEAREVLRRYPWPGNLGDLEAVLAVAACKAAAAGGEIDDAILHELLPHDPGPPGSLREQHRQHKREIIVRELDATGWNVARTAKNLCIARQALHRLMKELGIERPRGGRERR